MISFSNQSKSLVQQFWNVSTSLICWNQGLIQPGVLQLYQGTLWGEQCPLNLCSTSCSNQSRCLLLYLMKGGKKETVCSGSPGLCLFSYLVLISMPRKVRQSSNLPFSFLTTSTICSPPGPCLIYMMEAKVFHDLCGPGKLFLVSNRKWMWASMLACFLKFNVWSSLH